VGEKNLEKHERLWTKEEAMEFLGVGKSKLHDMITTHEIPSLKVGNERRFIPEQLWAWARKQTKV
jgi:excisionase family DNA binding protein